MDDKVDDSINVTSSRKIYELLDVIKRRPHIWLTTKSITSLQDFLNGYMQLGFGDDIYHAGQPSIDDFKYRILDKDKRNLGVGNPYRTVLLHECNGDEEKAFDRFFEYLEEFMKGKKI